MPRTVLIVPSHADPLNYLDHADTVGAGEIIQGIPPVWAEELNGVELPHVHVEPDPPARTPVESVGPAVPVEQPVTREEFDALLTLILETMGAS